MKIQRRIILFSKALLFVILSTALLGFASASDPGHGAGEISSGTFQSGDYVFPNNVNITNNFIVGGSNLYVNNANGYIGIGGVSPAGKLEIDTPTASAIGLIINTTDGSSTKNLVEFHNLTGLSGSVNSRGQGTFGGATHTSTNHGLTVYDEIVSVPGATGFTDFQVWKDSSPTYAIAFGMSKPGTPIGNDAVFSTYNGALWSERMRLNSSNGNVGIGTAYPYQLLDVRGNINVSNNVYLQNGTLAIGGNAGSAGYISQWQSGTILNNSVIYQNGNNIGIGTISPGATLAVASNGGNAGTGIEIDNTGGTRYGALYYNNLDGIYLTTQRLDSPFIYFGNNSLSQRVAINTSSGSVGIGAAIPTQLLDVRGNINVSNNVYLQNGTPALGGNVGSSGYISQFQNGAIVNNSVIYQNGNNVGINTIAASATLQVNGTSGAGAFSVVNNSNSLFFVNGSSGNVGIGTSSPAQLLHLSNSGSSVIRIDNNHNNSVPVFRSISASNANASSSIKINAPAGAVLGDVMIAHISNSGTRTMSPPAGWTLVRYINIGANSGETRTYYKVVNPPEPSSYNWSVNSDTYMVGAILDYSGVDTVNPIDAENGQANSYSTSQSTPSVTTSVPNDMIVALFTGLGNSSSSIPTWTPPSGMTERVQVYASAGFPDISLEDNDVAQSSVGATGTKTATINNTVYGSGQILALRPGVTSSWVLGVDNNSQQSFKVSASTMFGTNDYLTITTGGKVGIGTTTPYQLLDVRGNINVSNNVYLQNGTPAIGGNAGSSGYISQFQNGAIVNNSVIYQNGNNVGINTIAASATLQVNGTSGAGAFSVVNNSNSLFFVNGSSGNVGIGTTAPNSSLSVIGNITTSESIITPKACIGAICINYALIPSHTIVISSISVPTNATFNLTSDNLTRGGGSIPSSYASNFTVNINMTNYNRSANSNISARIGYWNLTAGYNNTDLNTSANGLVGYWHLDNNFLLGENNSFVVDSSGNANGTVVNYNPTTGDELVPSDGYYSRGFNILGSTTVTYPHSYISTTNSPYYNLSIYKSFTFSAWVKNNCPVIEGCNGIYILSKTDDSGHGYYWSISNGATTSGFSFSINTGGLSVNFNQPLVMGQWHNLIVTYNGTGNASDIIEYYDGKLVSKNVQMDSYISGSEINNNPLHVLDNYVLRTNYSADEVMFFNRSFSSDEAVQLYTQGRANWNYTDYQNLTAINSYDNSSSNSFNIPDWQSVIRPEFLLTNASSSLGSQNISYISNIFQEDSLNVGGTTNITSNLYVSGNIIDYGNITVKNNLIVQGAKVGFLSDEGVNVGRDSLEKGDLVSINYIDSNNLMTGGNIPIFNVQKTNGSTDRDVVGVVYEKLSSDGNYAPSRGSGIVTGDRLLIATQNSISFLKASAENGPILPGDYLAPADTPGYAMKADSDSQVLIGRALQTLVNGTGRISAFMQINAQNNNGAGINYGRLEKYGTDLPVNYQKAGVKPFNANTFNSLTSQESSNLKQNQDKSQSSSSGISAISEEDGSIVITLG